VYFTDHTEIHLNSESRLVTYVNKRGERSVMPLNQALDSNNMEMTKRLKYTKDILTHMLNNVQPVGGSSSQQPQRQVPHTAKGPAPPQNGLKANANYQTGL